MSENIDKFISEFDAALRHGTFVKASLGNYKGRDEHLQKVSFRPITTKKGVRVYVLYKFATRDVAKNFGYDELASLLRSLFAEGFSSGHLFTTTNDLQLEIGRKGRSRLNVAKPTHTAAPVQRHDREKQHLVDPGRSYLNALGITDDSGRVRDKAQDKWRQINKFVEILGNLVEHSALKNRTKLRIVDMGSGKGYLTFAVFDHFANTLGLDVQMTGVEARNDLVSICSNIANAGEFRGLSFCTGSIDNFDATGCDILIALHACNTATDDAIYKGIMAKAELIVAAPCCHQEIRPQITPPEMLRDVLKHGVLLERTAETITDGLRSLLLEREGYSVKMIEFVPVEHTPKNNMLVGTRIGAPKKVESVRTQIDEIKSQFGIRKHRLEDLLGV